MIPERSVKPAQNLIAAGIAAAVLMALAVVVAGLWSGIGDSDISGAGWLALALGVVVTLGLGVGLMALVFISSRHGYDEAARKED
jgi:hypothetical protein